MENADKTGSKEFCLIVFMEHSKDNTSNGRKKAVKKETILKEKRTQFFCNRKNTMAMLDIDNLKRHRGSSVDGILVSTGRTETTMTTKRYKFKSTTFGTAVHGTTERWVATVDHSVYVFNNRLTWTE